jgi:hypothetical protein
VILTEVLFDYLEHSLSINFFLETPEPKRVSTVMESPKDNGSPIGKPESPPLKHLDKPKRKRMKKLVSKTYINEDGEFGESELFCTSTV